MQRSSESIGTLAAALAKAQAELNNPEKSLTATIRSPFPREGDRTFRYAPLSSGLNLVRKSLGRHEIAAVQTTAIDMETGLIRLTTMLVHSSGEWVASDWPVCPVADTAFPHRMGAALTYARRYALFTLVGIAGEDDLDAPDLDRNPKPEPDQHSLVNGRPPMAPGRPVGGTARTNASRNKPIAGAKPMLQSDQSAALRDQLLGELTSIQSSDEATTWAQRSLPAKNTLTVDDAQVIEASFRARLAEFAHSQGADGFTSLIQTSDSGSGFESDMPTAGLSDGSHQGTGRVRLVSKTIRLRDKAHRQFVSRQACLVCGRTPSEPHHLRFAQPRALGRKVSDEFTVPICRLHHRELHRHGDEARWWHEVTIDPVPIALKLWQQSRQNMTATSMNAAEAAEREMFRENGHDKLNTTGASS
jgi:hypothetical protein